MSERPIERSEVLLRARVIGGLKLIDRGEADDKIIGVLEGDYVWDHVKDISQLAPVLVDASSTTSHLQAGARRA